MSVDGCLIYLFLLKVSDFGSIIISNLAMCDIVRVI